MNAVTTIEPALAKPGKYDAAHRFRSELIEEVARIEAWAVARLKAEGADIPYLAGQKIEAAKGLKPGDELAIAIEKTEHCFELRGLICHATISRTSHAYCFTPVHGQGADQWRPVVLTDAAMAEILSEARKLASKLLTAAKQS